MTSKYLSVLGGTAIVLALAACGDGGADRAAVETAPPQPMPDTMAVQTQQAPAMPADDMRLEVVLAERQLNVYRNGQIVETHPVAVGSSEWPTPTGEWSVGQVVWNPRWIPPEESWAEDEEVSEPGDPDNPLGRAQLVYSAPNSVHGTNDSSSLGQAVSHGSIRVSNEVAMSLARQVMEAGGAERDEAWLQRARDNPTERHDVPIPAPVPIVVR